jgi:hypothetical protein
MLTVDGQPVSDYVTFGRFLQVVLTKAEYGLARHPNAHVEVGVFGYAIATLQFAAFACGGVATYFGLATKPFCDRCEKYLKEIAVHAKTFVNDAEFEPFRERLYSLSPPSAAFLHILKAQHEVAKPKPGAVAVHWSLHACPDCRDQVLTEQAKVFNNKAEWSEVAALKRTFAVPAATPLLSEFNAAKDRKQYLATPAPR